LTPIRPTPCASCRAIGTRSAVHTGATSRK
jgi:hypothetical protein